MTIARSCFAVGLLAALGGCSNPIGPSAEGELQMAKAQWDQIGMTSYTFELRRACYCGYADAGYRVRVVVANGTAIDAYNTDLEATLTPAHLATMPTIEGLFTIIRNAIDQSADRIRVRYDAQTGVPLSINIDYRRNAIDDELSIAVYSLDPGSQP